MPTYSELTIAFSTDWETGDKLKIRTNDNGTVTTDQWTWVASRSTGFEVTEGTPTGNAGETAAINFKAAFDLDYPTGYVTAIQNTNEVLIQSETLGEDFVAAGGVAGNVGTETITFNNYVVPVDSSNVNLALTRSPHYITTPFYSPTTTDVTISLYIWDGDISSVPATATTTLSRIRPTVDYEEMNTDISGLIRSRLNEVPAVTVASVSQIVDSGADNLKWVKFVASYTDASEDIADVEDLLAGVDGYGLYSEGANPTRPASRVLTNVAYRLVASDSVILLPFINDTTITNVDVDTDGGEVNASHTITSSGQSTDFIQYVCIDCSQITTDTVITVDFGATTIEYEIQEECRYTPKTIFFKNRYGVFDTVVMFKKSSETLEVDKGKFINNYISEGTYTTTKHQFHDINFKAKKSIKLNSGYIDEDENDLYEQLMLSDKVFFYEGSTFIPVNVKKSSWEKQTRVNDGLVKYEMEFEYSYNIIQNV